MKFQVNNYNTHSGLQRKQNEFKLQDKYKINVSFNNSSMI